MTDEQLITAIADVATGSPNTALEIRTLLTELFNRSDKSGTIKIKDCSDAYIVANFDGTGLGINLEVGYAICNGANGTRNWAGRVPLAYGTGYTTMGATGGFKDAVLVSHSHKSISVGLVAGTFDVIRKFLGSLKTTGINLEYDLQGRSDTPTAGETTTEGETGADKNMQPYTVVLVTMKL
jgi:hypothetical protein